MNFALEQPLALLLLAIPAAVLLWLLLTRNGRGGGLHLGAILRVALLAVVALALSGPRVGMQEEGVNVLYLVDRSQSAHPVDEAALGRIVEESAEHAGSDDTAGVLSFAAESAVEQFPTAGELRLSLRAEHDRSQTDIESGLYGALSAFPADGEKRVVLISDGNETRGSAVDTARSLNRAGITVHTLPLGQQEANRPEVAVRRLIAPNESRAAEPHELRLVVYARQRVEAEVQIFRDGEYWGGDEVSLQPGDNVFRYTGRLDEPGLHTYRARIDTSRDTILENNESGAVIDVAGPPRLLYVHGEGNQAPSFLNALSAQGIEIEEREVSQIPTDLTELADYASVVFDNVPAYDLSLAAMENLERYVRDLGRGFLMLGGDRSFGAGGYYQTPIERLLPVDMDVTSSMQIPSLAMTFVIDKSGSMGNTSTEGTSKLDIVKQAVLASIRLMNPFYEVGLLAFDASFEWAVEITRAGERQRIERDLASLSSGGGTVLGPALEEAFRALRSRNAAVRHIVVLSDGLTSDEEFEGLTQQIRRAGITVSTVAVGGNSDRNLMERIAEWGGGRAYRTDSIRSVPRIFTAETNLVSRNLIVEEPFVPERSSESPILSGIERLRLPILDGFVLTYPKADSREVLGAVQGNPLLATRQYGLGRSAAFTTDVRGRWSQQWLQWEEFPQFAGQLVRWTQPAGEDESLEVDIRQEAETAHISVDATDRAGRYLNMLPLRARMVTPDGEQRTAQLEQVAPGRYEGELPIGGTGHYLVTVASGEEIAPTTTGLYVGYSPEYSVRSGDVTALADIARAGGGRMLTREQLRNFPELYQQSRDGGRSLAPIRLPLLIAALALFLIDLFITYVLRPARAARREAAMETGGGNVAHAGPPEAGAAVGGGGHRTRKSGSGRAATAAGGETASSNSAPAAASRDEPEGAGHISYEEARRSIVESYREERSKKRKETPEWYSDDPDNEVAARKIYRKGRKRSDAGSDSSSRSGSTSRSESDSDPAQDSSPESDTDE